MDPGAVDLLLKANEGYKNFKKMKPYTVTVRPWFLDDYAKKLNINVITQFALYKCMHGVCLFACDSEENWKIHMEQHLNLIDVLAEKKLLKREYRAELVKFRECAYCGSEPNEKTPLRMDAVCRHMEMEHRRNTFQCAHCYYRTIEIDNMILHMEKYHRDSDREILLYGVNREFQDSDKDELEQCHQKIARIRCNLGKHDPK